MPMLYDLPTNITDFPTLMATPNDYTGGMFWNFVLIGMYIVVFGIMKTRGHQTVSSFSATAFFVGIISMLLALIPNLISVQALLVTQVLAIFGLLMLLFYRPRHLAED